MSTYYDENRKNEILKALSKEKLLTEKELYKSEELPVLKEFVNSLLNNIVLPEGYSFNQTLSSQNLPLYLRGFAKELGIKEDEEIKYAADQIERLNKKIFLLKKGFDGELLAKRAMFGISAPNHILYNQEYTIDGIPFEIDAIVINEKGIQIVEVKSIHRDLVVNEDGVLVDVNSGRTYCNIKMKLNNSVHAIRRVLEKVFPDDTKMISLAGQIRSILLTTDGSIYDSRGEIVVAECNNIVRILDNSQDETVLNEDEIEKIASALEDAAHARRYPIKCDFSRIADAYATAEAQLEFFASQDPLDLLFYKNFGVELSFNDDTEEAGVLDYAKRFPWGYLPLSVRRHKKAIKTVACIVAIGMVFGISKIRF